MEQVGSILELRPQDLDAVVALWLEGSRQAHHFIPFSFWESNALAMKEIYIPQSDTWVYLKPCGEVTGFISLVENYIAALFVQPEMQGGGIGGKLIEKAKFLRDELSLAVYVKNSQACQFYHKHGFQITQTRPEQNTGEVEHLMIWRRSGSTFSL